MDHRRTGDSRVDYGTSPGPLPSSASSPTLVVSHTLALGPLLPTTTYYYRVTSQDGSGNAATEPAPPAAPLSFTTPAPEPEACAVDATAAHFSAGTLSGTSVSVAADGEVTLAPTLDVDFAGAALPAGWASFEWPYDDPAVGVVTVAGGLLTLDGARANPEPFGTAPGVSLEFVATFSGAPNQHVGFGAGSQLPPNEVYNTTPWAMFSTQTGGSLKARTHTGGTPEDISLGTGLLGAPHRFRIDWEASLVRFWVDGVVVHTSGLAVAGTMRPAASDLFFGDGALTVDWMRMTPYAASGTFLSRVHDAGAPVSWAALSWTANVPAGTSLVLSARAGDDPDPGHASWTAFQSVAASGDPLGLCARYVQYRAELATADLMVSPSLEDVTFSCAPSAVPAAITDLASAPAAGPPDASGRTGIALTWSAASGPVQVWRKGHGDYPLYRPGVGMAPSVPASPSQAIAEGWTLTAVTSPGGEDQPATRDFWYYVAFVGNACGSASAASNLAGGRLDYVLGDFSNGAAACAGDNAVDGADLTLLGAHYGEATSGPGDPLACVDVGPTVGYSPLGLPLPDGLLEFEDLVICALNYTGTGTMPLLVAGAKAGTSMPDALQLRVPELPAVGEVFFVPVWAGGGGRIHALGLDLGFDPARVEILGVEAGSLLDAQPARSLVLSPRPGRIDVALLGGERGLAGEGELVRVRCRRIAAGDPGLVLAHADARDGTNRAVELGGAAPPTRPAPSVTQLAPARPNPFRGTVTLAFQLATAGPAELSLYSVDGRRVRTLARGAHEAGEYVLTWDGRDDQGAQAPTGVYYVRLVCSAGRLMRSVTYVR